MDFDKMKPKDQVFRLKSSLFQESNRQYCKHCGENSFTTYSLSKADA